MANQPRQFLVLNSQILSQKSKNKCFSLSLTFLRLLTFVKSLQLGSNGDEMKISCLATAHRKHPDNVCLVVVVFVFFLILRSWSKTNLPKKRKRATGKFFFKSVILIYYFFLYMLNWRC